MHRPSQMCFAEAGLTLTQRLWDRGGSGFASGRWLHINADRTEELAFAVSHFLSSGERGEGSNLEERCEDVTAELVFRWGAAALGTQDTPAAFSTKS